MRRSGRIARAAGTVGLLAVGALVLHQLRYLLVFGGGVGPALERHGHSYLETAAPLLVGLAVAALVVSVVVPVLLRVARGAARGACTTERAAAYAAALLAVHLSQELTEGALAAGHPDGLAGALGAGGWITLPLAMALGALAAFARELLLRTESRLAAAIWSRPAPRPRRGLALRGTALRRPHSPALRFGLAPRPPPFAHPV